MLTRAWSTFEIKALDEDQRVIEGFVTTPTPDRRGDIVDPLGAQFALPMPLLWQHDQGRPVGEVLTATVTSAGIAITAKFARVVEAGTLRDRLDEAWQSVKARLVRGLSIGFRPLEAVPIKKADPFGPMHIKRWQWAETSAVTIPANLEATITAIKSAALGHTSDPGATGLPIVRVKGARPMENTYSEQISAHEATRTNVVAQLTALMEKADADGVTFDEAQSKQYDALTKQVDALDLHLKRLHDMERFNASQAKPIEVSKPPAIVQVKSLVEPGTAFVRMACAKLVCNGNLYEAAEYARRWDGSTPEVALALKAAVAAGTTTDSVWAGPLVNQNIANDFLELLRPATIIGRIGGLRRVPFNTKVPSQTTGGTYGWVGEGKPKSLTSLAFSSEAVTYSKAAGIIVLTEELVRLSSPSAEALVRGDMIAGIAQFLDTQFIDPTVALLANVHPASITNGADTAVATAFPLADLLGLLAHFATYNIGVSGLHIIMSEVNALAMSFHTNLDGSPVFPGVGINGGTYRGITIVTSQAAGTSVIALQPSLILFADEGGVSIDASREASLQMDSAPDSPATATTVMVSLWQHNLVGLRAERMINWKRAHAHAVKYLTAAAYPAPSGAAARAAEETPPRDAKRER